MLGQVLLWMWLGFTLLLLLLPAASSELFNSEGKLTQLEYAQQAALKGGTVLAIRGKESVVILTSSARKKKSTEDEYILQKVKEIQDSTYFIGSGILADVELVEKFLFREGLKHEKTFNSKMPVKRLAQLLADVLQTRSMEESRPLGIAALLIGMQKHPISQINEICVLEIDPAGAIQECNVACIGQNSKQILKKWPKSKISTEIDEEELIETASSCLSKAWKDLLEEQEESSDLLEVDVDDGKMNTALNYMMDSVDLHIIKKGSKLQRIAMKNWKVRNTASEAVK